MSQIQKRLNDLQPYVAGIRFVQGLPVVDVIFKEGWSVPDSKVVHKEVSEQDPNYCLFYTQKEGVGFDELLDYVEDIIKINLEREIKQELLKIKVKELQILFKENSLDKLKTLKFVIGKDNLVPDLMNDDFNVEIELGKTADSVQPPKVEVPNMEENISTPHQHHNTSAPPPVRTKKPGIGEVELPPKGEKIVLEDHSLPESVTHGDCSCGENEACPKCMDRKGL